MQLHHHIDGHLLRAHQMLDEPPPRESPAWDEMHLILEEKLGDYTVSPAQRTEALALSYLVRKMEGEVIRADVLRAAKAASPGFDWNIKPPWWAYVRQCS